jgi:hypothetical protein
MREEQTYHVHPDNAQEVLLRAFDHDDACYRYALLLIDNGHSANIIHSGVGVYHNGAQRVMHIDGQNVRVYVGLHAKNIDAIAPLTDAQRMGLCDISC